MLLGSLRQGFGGDGAGRTAGEHDGAFGHACKLDPLTGQLSVGFLKPDARGASRSVLRCFRKFQITGDSFFAIIVRTHTCTVQRAATPFALKQAQRGNVPKFPQFHANFHLL